MYQCGLSTKLKLNGSSRSHPVHMAMIVSSVSGSGPPRQEKSATENTDVDDDVPRACSRSWLRVKQHPAPHASAGPSTATANTPPSAAYDCKTRQSRAMANGLAPSAFLTRFTSVSDVVV